MKYSSTELKKQARATLNGNWGIAVGLSFLVGFLITLLPTIMINPMKIDNFNIFSLLTEQAILLILSLIGSLFTVGLSFFYLNLARGKKRGASDILYAFKNHPDRFLFAAFLLVCLQLIVLLPYYIANIYAVVNHDFESPYYMGAIFITLLLTIVLIPITLMFSLVMELLIDNKDMGTIEAFKQSARLMKGNKGRLFYIQLSFIGWFFLSIFTCYIGLLWIIPYMEMTLAYFYLDVIGELNAPFTSSQGAPSYDTTDDYSNPTEYYKPMNSFSSEEPLETISNVPFDGSFDSPVETTEVQEDTLDYSYGSYQISDEPEDTTTSNS